MAEPDLDVIVIGGGAAGEAAGFLTPELGGRAAVVERDLLGGQCPFWACMPSKTLLASAAVRACDATYPWQRASDRRDWMISREGTAYPDDAGHQRALEGVGTRVLRGEARIVAPGTVEVTKDGSVQTLRARSIIVAAGSTPFIPPIDGIDTTSYWTSADATSTRELPSSLVILGGGVVGVELAQVFLRFGVAVTMVEGGDRILAREHPLTSTHHHGPAGRRRAFSCAPASRPPPWRWAARGASSPFRMDPRWRVRPCSWPWAGAPRICGRSACRTRA